MSSESAIKLLGASTTWAVSSSGLCVVNSPQGKYESEDGGLTWFLIVERGGGRRSHLPIQPSELSDALQDLVGRPIALVRLARCENVGETMKGRQARCDLAEGHPGNHRHGDFEWVDAEQAKRDAALAKEAEATLDREISALDGLLADVVPVVHARPNGLKRVNPG